jgi:mannose-6-phosphate isomerase-like protein (cupin superfamily)
MSTDQESSEGRSPPSSVLRPPSSGELYRIIEFTARHGNCGGSLIQFQPGAGPENALPFSIAKVLYMTDIAPDDVRGRHAHHRTQEIAVCLEGACTFELDDGLGRRESIRLDRPELAILLPPRVWRVYRNFAPGTKMLVIADTPYDEADYIRDRTAFERLADGAWSGERRAESGELGAGSGGRRTARTEDGAERAERRA